MTPSRVAIVGIGVIASQCHTPDQFWSLIRAGIDTSRPVPPDRWVLPPEIALNEHPGVADRVYSNRGYFVDPFTLDTTGLALDSAVLAGLDPVFHLVLHAGRQAFDDAVTAPLRRERIGVILGNIVLPTETASRLAEDILGRTFAEQLLRRPGSVSRTDPRNRYVAGLPAGVLAHAFGLGGGSFTLDAACASSLYAIKLAVDELLAGRCDAMLAGGVSRPDCLYTQMGFSQLRALSPSGRCSPFDVRADGLVVGEGAGIVLLKRLEDAVTQGDHIYGVLVGAGISNDVHGNLLAPDSEGQLRAMWAAYQRAGWEPQQTDLIECHATGTPVGDATEFASLRKLWEGRRAPQPCILGTVKANIGHTLTAAGAMGLIKVLLALKHETLPPGTNFTEPAPGLGYVESPFRLLSESVPWLRREEHTPRRAAINAFGFGGINAHLLLEEWFPEERSRSTPIPVSSRSVSDVSPSPIAVVGMDAHLGQWRGLEAVAHRLLGVNGESVVLQDPEKRWWGVEHAPWFQHENLTPRTFAGYRLPDLRIPVAQFRIPPRELEETLPQQLLMLQVVAGALTDVVGTPADRLHTGVFIGVGLDLNTTNFQLRWSLPAKIDHWNEELRLGLDAEQKRQWLDKLLEKLGPPLTANRTMGALGSIVASRIARQFHLGGPGFTVSSEESSGVQALLRGVRLLQQGEIDQAIVGTVDLAGEVRAMLTTHRLRPFSRRGQATPFSREADGTVMGEGAVALVLKRLHDAERDGDQIYALIDGIGSATGGDITSLSTSPSAHRLALDRACAEAHLSPAAIQYIETHGSGDPHEDHIEASALADLTFTNCILGSAKTAVGHTGAAAGLVSVLKAVLCLQRRVLPSLPFSGPLRSELATYAFSTHPSHWLRDRVAGSRHALVTSFGVDGNCHQVLLREAPSPRPSPPLLPAHREVLFACSADNVPGLVQRLTDLEGLIADTPLVSLAQRWHREHSPNQGQRAIALLARSHGELRQLLGAARTHLTEHPIERPGSVAMERIFYTPNPLGPQGELAFVFSGSGNHFPGMGRELGLAFPEVMRKQDRENHHLRGHLLPELFWERTNLDDLPTPDLIIGQVALATVVSDILATLGLRPQAALGYSLGESSALFALRAWTARDEMFRRMRTLPLFREDLSGECAAARRVWRLSPLEKVDWIAGVVPCPAATVRQALAGRERVYLLISNAPRECVLGGQRSAVEALLTQLGCGFYPLPGVSTVHCSIAQEVTADYHTMHLLPTTPPNDVRFYSSAWGRSYPVTAETAADAILAQAVSPVDFPALVEQTYRDGVRLFVEIGPGTSCTRMIGQILGDRPHWIRSACAPGDALGHLLRVIAGLVAERVPVNLDPLQQSLQDEANTLPGGPVVTLPLGGGPFEVPPLPHPSPVATPGEPEHPRASVTIAPAPSPQAPTEITMARAPVDPVLRQLSATVAAGAEAHQAHLRFSQRLTEIFSQQLGFQMSLMSQGAPVDVEPPPRAGEENTPSKKPCLLDRAQCLEFAVGSIARVLGTQFREVDSLPTRVRLPDEPLMLVDRIVAVEGEPLLLQAGRVITEHDIHSGAWYLDSGRIPTCIAIESGQADLFLCGYLGIDFRTRGLAVYRLLDAAVTFHRELPRAGETIQYDIHIDHFFRQGDTYLFRFHFEGSINGQLLLTMRDGCAGFFTEADLHAGKGIVLTELQRRPLPRQRPADWVDWVPIEGVESYTEAQLDALRVGDLAGCFGPRFQNLPLKHPLTIPGGRMRLVHRVVELDPRGGRYGLGAIRAEADIDPQAWFLTCHFVDDRVMPGTLMYECCLHTLRIFLIRMGFVGESERIVCEPIPGVASRLKCRGQVLETTRTVTYEVFLKQMDYRPAPAFLCDAFMYADGKLIVEITDMALQVSGLTREFLRTFWEGVAQTNPVVDSALSPRQFDRASVLAFAEGKPSQAFGDRYRPFDQGRFIARLPRPPYSFIDRVHPLQVPPWKMQSGGPILVEYDVPPDAWYFQAERQGTMPYAVLLEVALQACGWMAAYMGSALTSPIDLRFRNLGGSAIQHRPVTVTSGTLATEVHCTQVSSSAGMIIQNYRFEVRDQQGAVFAGDTYFGFFTLESLADQVGIREVAFYQPGEEEQQRGRRFAYPVTPPYPDRMLRMIDQVDLLVLDGGPKGLGLIEGSKTVDPEEWFFEAHFYQDPVWPGSLGLEAMVQLLKVIALERWGAEGRLRVQPVIAERPHRWVYRGQVVPENQRVTVQAWVTTVDEKRKTLWADGLLAVDGRIIYRMVDFALSLMGDE